jgi:hypothetical protein
MKTKSLLKFVVILTLGFTACTKKIPFEALPEEVIEKDVLKSLLDTQSEYLYSASQQNSSRSAADAFPFLSGENKRVKLQLTQEALRIIEVERDQRFASNTLNNKVVLEIPVEHVQYGCKKDRFGECTNTEEKNIDLRWDQRDTVKVKLEEIKSGELELLPILSSSEFGENCYENVSSRLIKSDIEKDAINFQIERVFKTKLNCLSNDIASLSDATVSAVYHYSLVKTSAVLSKDYETISYPEGSKDEQTFGFFTSQRTQLDVDNNNTDKSRIQIMNRWNPNRSEIVYFLSEEFAKPENKILKDLTHQTVKNLNQGLEEAGVKFRINLKDAAGHVPGDIRNSMIVLVEDPVASSVIGYGPQTEDPVTGEIISARTVMFLGTIKKFARYTYDEIVREKQRQKRTVARSGFQLSKTIQNQVDALKKTGKVFGLSQLTESVSVQPTSLKKSEKLIVAQSQIQKAVQSIKNYTAQKNQDYSGRDLKSKIKYLNEVKNCAFAPHMDAVAGGVSEKLLGQFSDNLKPWDQLSNSEKEKVLALILPQIWVPTLIHELGHNLGLRHNFAASEDKDNFFSEQELAKKGVDHVMPFSSVMDYGNDLKTLPFLGKYDLAALKFGYGRKVTVVNEGQETLIDVSTTLDDLMKKDQPTLKEFAFCTDEHTGINAGCKRFDLGTNYTEIVQNLIQDYEQAYSTRNLRAGRASFSHMDDLSYLSRISGIFRDLRIMMEVVERIKYKFQLSESAPEWESVPFLKDLKQATLIGGSFLAQVLLVPDIHCAISLAKNPSEIIAVIPAAQIDPEALNCQSLALNPEYKVVGQAGKSLNSKKDPNSRNNYVDQIDVRGIWLDKVAAMQTLTARTIDISTMNDHTDSFLNVPELRQSILNVVQGLMLDNVVNRLEFTMLDGSKQHFEVQYDMGETQLIQRPMIVDAIVNSSLSDSNKKRIMARLGVNEVGTTPLKQIIAKKLAVNAVDPNRVHTADDVLRDVVSIYKFDSVSNVTIDSSKARTVLNNVQYVADSQNYFGRQAIENLPLVRLMDKVDEKDLTQLLDLKVKNGQFPEIAGTENEEVKAKLANMKNVFEKVDAEKLQDYLMGIVKTEKFYQELLQVLPAAN